MNDSDIDYQFKGKSTLQIRYLVGFRKFQSRNHMNGRVRREALFQGNFIGMKLVKKKFELEPRNLKILIC